MYVLCTKQRHRSCRPSTICLRLMPELLGQNSVQPSGGTRCEEERLVLVKRQARWPSFHHCHGALEGFCVDDDETLVLLRTSPRLLLDPGIQVLRRQVQELCKLVTPDGAVHVGDHTGNEVPD